MTTTFKPAGINDEAWKLIKANVVQRWGRGSDDLPVFIKDMDVDGLEVYADGAIIINKKNLPYTIYTLNNHRFSYCIRSDTISSWQSKQENIMNVSAMDKKYAADSRLNKEQLERDYDSFKGFDAYCAALHGPKQEGYYLLRGYQTAVRRARLRDSILFTGDKILPAILKSHGAKISKAFKRGNYYVVVTNKLSVSLNKNKKQTYDIGTYTFTIEDAPDRVRYTVTRHEGTIKLNQDGGYLSSYITDGDQDGTSTDVCFGSNSNIVSNACETGDVHTVIVNLLDVIDQPNYESESPYRKWKELIKGLYPDLKWCRNCGELECTCTTCYAAEDSPHKVTRVCERCGYCSSHCRCVECCLSTTGKCYDPINIMVQMPTLDGNCISREFCGKHFKQEYVAPLQTTIKETGTMGVGTLINSWRTAIIANAPTPVASPAVAARRASPEAQPIPGDVEAALRDMTGIIGNTPIAPISDSDDDDSDDYDYSDEDEDPED